MFAPKLLPSTPAASAPQRSRWALYSATAALLLSLSACETMPGGQGADAGLGNVVTAISGVFGGNAGGSGNGIQEMVQGASSVFKDYSAQEQRVLGQQFAAVLLGSYPLLRNNGAQRYVNQVGAWVAQQADLPRDGNGQTIQYQWRFGVLDSSSINAFATPGGYVFITKGLLQRMESEAQLAGVLGHEIAHVVRGHYLKALKKGGVSQIAGGLVMHKTGQKQLNQVLVNAARNIYAKGLDQSDEFDADQYGMLYAARAGYAPEGLASVLELYAANSTQSNTPFSTLLSTHPNPNTRIDRLAPLLSQPQYAQAGRGTNPKRYQQMRRTL